MSFIDDAIVQQLLKGRYIAALASENPDGSIHMVAVWYWFDGAKIFVTTSSRSKKGKNAQSNPKVSIMIDSRDPLASFGATIVGAAKILTGQASQQRGAEIHRKYMSDAALADPKVGPVFATFDDITIEITPTSVISWDMRVLDQQMLGSVFANNPSYMLPLER
ncbi:MAG: pyridoxamine 5'-phosphate oxidase family protein [Candidatus Sulfotelmatobacter sp.]